MEIERKIASFIDRNPTAIDNIISVAWEDIDTCRVPHNLGIYLQSIEVQRGQLIPCWLRVAFSCGLLSL